MTCIHAQIIRIPSQQKTFSQLHVIFYMFGPELEHTYCNYILSRLYGFPTTASLL